MKIINSFEWLSFYTLQKIINKKLPANLVIFRFIAFLVSRMIPKYVFLNKNLRIRQVYLSLLVSYSRLKA